MGLEPLYSTNAQWSLLLPLLVALVLSAAVGLEREISAKSAGLRTHTLVGVGAAVFMEVSKYGFSDLLTAQHVVLDPSRVAAQVVSGIGFIGGGLIFVRQDAVRGLTTAATVWLVAGVGMASGGGLPVVAVAATAGHFLITRGFPPLARAAGRLRRTPPTLRLTYLDGHGVLRSVLTACTERGWSVQRLLVNREGTGATGERMATVTLRLAGKGYLHVLAGDLAELPGVRSADTGEDEDSDGSDEPSP